MTVNTIETPGEYDAIEKAKPDELIFALLERDWAAPKAIEHWVDLRRGKASQMLLKAKDDNKSSPELETWYKEEMRQCSEAEAIAHEMIARQRGQNVPVEVVRTVASTGAPPSDDPKADALAKLRAEVAEADYHLHNAIEFALLALSGDDAAALSIKGAANMVHSVVMGLSPRRAELQGAA